MGGGELLGCVPHGGASVLMGGGGGSKKIVGWGASPSYPHPTMGNPLYGKFYADNE